MRKTRRNRTLKDLRKNDYPILKRYKDNDVCKNAIFEKEKIPDTTLEIDINKGCKNLRANGSSRCEKCSKKYNAKK